MSEICSCCDNKIKSNSPIKELCASCFNKYKNQSGMYLESLSTINDYEEMYQRIKNAIISSDEQYTKKERILILFQEWIYEKAMEKLGLSSVEELREKLESENEIRVIEENRQDYARSIIGLYEYDVVTVLNLDHGRVDAIKMRELINNRAQEGWKLHTVYSNELGKNAVRVLGLGMNSTACEDVLIFERKLRD